MVDTAAVCSGRLWWAADIVCVVLKLKGAVIFPDMFPHPQATYINVELYWICFLAL